MDIRTSRKRPKRKPTPPTERPTDIPEGVIDRSELPADAKRVPPLKDVFDVMNVEPPVLKRPLLMVHGLAQHADTWTTFKSHLSSRPENKWGGVYRADKEKEFQAKLADKPDSKIFALDISDNLAAPRVVANEVRRAITAIMESTGAKSVDVVTHSMGSLVTREARRQGEDGFDNLLMVAPPNQGAYEATLATFFGDSGIYEHYPKEKLGAMDALRVEYDRSGDVRNVWLHELNEFWGNDRNRPRAAIITGIGIPTPDRSLKGLSPGDGMVAARRAPLEGAEFHLAVPNKLDPNDSDFRDFQDFRYNHLQIVSEPEIFQVAGDFLSGAENKVDEKPSFEQALKDTKQSNQAAAKEIETSVARQASVAKRQTWGTRLAGLGAATALAGVAAMGNPVLSSVLVGAGALTLGAGALYGHKNAKQLGLDSKATVDSAERSLNMADTLIHRYRREISPAEGTVSRDTLREYSNQAGEARVEVVEADFDRRHQIRWQRRGAGFAALGVAAAAAGVAVRGVVPWLGTAVGIAGGVAVAAGGAVSLVSSERMSEPAENALKLSREALQLSSDLVGEFS